MNPASGLTGSYTLVTKCQYQGNLPLCLADPVRACHKTDNCPVDLSITPSRINQVCSLAPSSDHSKITR